MSSVLAWLDSDDDQRRRMLAVVELFKDEGTVDELGIGAIRDTISDVLFPGTSVLHTRARYLLFVPWLLLAAQRTAGVAAAGGELRRLEARLIYALLAGGEKQGVIGSQAKDRLKSMPSAAYWAATYRFGIRLWDTSVEGHFRRALSADAQHQVEPEADDPETFRSGRAVGLDPYLPPPPDGLLTSVTFDLSAGEAGFLRDRLLSTTKGSLLAWLLAHSGTTAGDRIWAHPAYAEFPVDLRNVVDHGRRFHTAIHGAALLYNLLLAEQRDSNELIERYRDQLNAWQAELRESAALIGWDLADFWATVKKYNPRIGEPTRMFVTRWVDGASQGAGVADDPALRALVKEREIHLKRGRARLANPSALDAWRGGSGLVRLDYRWGVAQQLLGDIYRVSQAGDG